MNTFNKLTKKTMKIYLITATIGGIVMILSFIVAYYESHRQQKEIPTNLQLRVNAESLINPSIKTTVGITLDDGQLAFINECKNKGYTGCFLTINNQQIWVSFISNK